MTSILRVKTSWTGVSGAPFLSTHYFTRTDGDSAAYAADAVAAFWTGLAGQIDNDLDWNIEGDVAVINDATGQLTGVDTISGGNSGGGTDSGQACPPATQGLMRILTSTVVAGRVLRGRFFIPGVTENNSNEGVPSGDYLSAAASAFTAMMDSPSSELRVYSPTHNTSAPVTAGSLWNQWAVLRSRRD